MVEGRRGRVVTAGRSCCLIFDADALAEGGEVLGVVLVLKDGTLVDWLADLVS